MDKRKNRWESVSGFRGTPSPEASHWMRELRKSSAV